MAQRNVPHTVKMVTREGEVTVQIVLELNINLNANGVQVAAQATAQPISPAPDEDEVEKLFDIPNFSNQRIKFGKVEY